MRTLFFDFWDSKAKAGGEKNGKPMKTKRSAEPKNRKFNRFFIHRRISKNVTPFKDVRGGMSRLSVTIQLFFVAVS
jgi:hypothetical protein